MASTECPYCRYENCLSDTTFKVIQEMHSHWCPTKDPSSPEKAEWDKWKDKIAAVYMDVWTR